MAANTSTQKRILASLLTSKVNFYDIATTDTLGLAELAQKEGVASVLYGILSNNGVNIESHPNLMLLSQISMRASIIYILRLQTIAKLHTIAKTHDFTFLFLKGSILADTVYPMPTQRAAMDIDILVPEQQVSNVLATLVNSGFHSNRDSKDVLIDPLSHIAKRWSHHYILTNDLTTVELHHRLYNDYGKDWRKGDATWFWKKTQLFDINGMSLLGLQPEANFLYLSGHALFQHQKIRLINLYDLHLIITRTPNFDWGLIAEQAVEMRWVWILEQILEELVDLFDTPIPEGFLDELRPQKSPMEMGIPNIYRQFQDNLAQMEPLERAILSFRGLCFTEQIQVVQQILFPSITRVRSYDPTQQPIWNSYWNYWYHLGVLLYQRLAQYWKKKLGSDCS